MGLMSRSRVAARRRGPRLQGSISRRGIGALPLEHRPAHDRGWAKLSVPERLRRHYRVGVDKSTGHQVVAVARIAEVCVLICHQNVSPRCQTIGCHRFRHAASSGAAAGIKHIRRPGPSVIAGSRTCPAATVWPVSPPGASRWLWLRRGHFRLGLPAWLRRAARGLYPAGHGLHGAGHRARSRCR